MNRRTFLKLGLASGVSLYLTKVSAPSATELVRSAEVVSLDEVSRAPTVGVSKEFPLDPHVGDIHCLEGVGMFVFNGSEWLFI